MAQFLHSFLLAQVPVGVVGLEILCKFLTRLLTNKKTIRNPILDREDNKFIGDDFSP